MASKARCCDDVTPLVAFVTSIAPTCVTLPPAVLLTCLNLLCNLASRQGTARDMQALSPSVARAVRAHVDDASIAEGALRLLRLLLFQQHHGHGVPTLDDVVVVCQNSEYARPSWY